MHDKINWNWKQFILAYTAKIDSTDAILCEDRSMIQSGAVGRKGPSQRCHNQGFGCENGCLCSDAAADQEQSIVPRLDIQPKCFTLALVLCYDRCYDVWAGSHYALSPAFIGKKQDGDHTIHSNFQQHTLPSDFCVSLNIVVEPPTPTPQNLLNLPFLPIFPRKIGKKNPNPGDSESALPQDYAHKIDLVNIVGGCGGRNLASYFCVSQQILWLERTWAKNMGMKRICNPQAAHSMRLAASHHIDMNIKGNLNDPLKRLFEICVRACMNLEIAKLESPKIHWILNQVVSVFWALTVSQRRAIRACKGQRRKIHPQKSTQHQKGGDLNGSEPWKLPVQHWRAETPPKFSASTGNNFGEISGGF